MMMAHVIVFKGLRVWMAHVSGSRMAISRSKSRNRMPTIKNRIDRGKRAEPRGSNPHS